MDSASKLEESRGDVIVVMPVKMERVDMANVHSLTATDLAGQYGKY
jgi:hypothetical protein